MDNRPNIVYIMSDDHTANAISAYGSRLADVFKTPNIDSIANEGARLAKCFCTNALCTPSRATIMTSMHCHETGVRVLSDTLPTTLTTFPMLLQQSGYSTALMGKWHLHSEPQGFDEYSIFPSQGTYWDPWFMNTGFDWSNVCTHRQNELGVQEKGYVTDIVTKKAVDYIKRRDTSKPFLLFCQHKAPHDNFEYHPRYEHIFDEVEMPEPDTLWEDHSLRSPATRDRGTSVSSRSSVRSYVNLFEEPSNWSTGGIDYGTTDEKARTKIAYQKYVKDYLRTAKGVDDSVGEVIKALKDEGIYDNTIIIYTSDQGMFLGEHDFIDKRWIYEEAMQMPFVIRYPKEIKAGNVVEQLVGNFDFAPTILDFANIEAPKQMRGHSMRGLLSGTSEIAINDCIYYRYWVHLTHHDNPAHYGIRTDKYKLIFFYALALDAGSDTEPTTPGWELYDLEKDPFETKDVYFDPAYREIALELTAKLDAVKKEIGDTDEQYPELLKLREECPHVV